MAHNQNAIGRLGSLEGVEWLSALQNQLMGSVPTGRSDYTADGRVGSLGPLVVIGEGRPALDETILLRGVQAGLSVPPVEPVRGVQDGGATQCMRCSPARWRRPAALAAQAAVEEATWGRTAAGDADGGVHR
jgi:hypothetical protein